MGGPALCASVFIQCLRRALFHRWPHSHDTLVCHPQAMLLPPSAPERTFQASGQGQAIARPKGGPPCCSVPVPSTRWAASGASPPLKTSRVCRRRRRLVCACTKTSSHTHTCVRVQPNEIPGRRNPEENRLPARANHKTFANGSKHHRSCPAHASNFSCCTRDPPQRASLSGQE